MHDNSRDMTIAGIPVRADLSLSSEEIRQIVCEISQAWTWEGRQLGRIELIRVGQWVHICSYEQPVTQLVPAKLAAKE